MATRVLTGTNRSNPPNPIPRRPHPPPARQNPAGVQRPAPHSAPARHLLTARPSPRSQIPTPSGFAASRRRPIGRGRPRPRPAKGGPPKTGRSCDAELGPPDQVTDQVGGTKGPSRARFGQDRARRARDLMEVWPHGGLASLVATARGKTPDPIPNSAVKTLSADGTARQRVEEQVAARLAKPPQPPRSCPPAGQSARSIGTVNRHRRDKRNPEPNPQTKPPDSNHARGVEQPGSSSGS